MAFDALEISLQIIRALRPLQARIRRRDPGLHRQVRSAASSICLNLAEGRRRNGRDREHHFRVAAGSADELRAALRVAEAWGDLRPKDVRTPVALIDRVLAMTWRLTR